MPVLSPEMTFDCPAGCEGRKLKVTTAAMAELGLSELKDGGKKLLSKGGSPVTLFCKPKDMYEFYRRHRGVYISKAGARLPFVFVADVPHRWSA